MTPSEVHEEIRRREFTGGFQVLWRRLRDWQEQHAEDLAWVAKWRPRLQMYHQLFVDIQQILKWVSFMGGCLTATHYIFKWPF